MHLTSTPALSVRNLSKRFGDTTAVSSLDLEVHHGEVVSLIGPSGCGKTTTLRLVAGLETPDSGSIFLDGRPADATPPEKRQVGFVFQDYALFPHLTVEANIAFGLHRIPRLERRARVAEVVALVGLDGMENRLPRELSGGQQQRVALARALAPKPTLLLLDEPFSNLDPELRRHVRHDVLAIIRESGAAAIWVTHDRDEGLIVADRVVLMKDGVVRQAGTPSELWHEPADAWVAAFVGQGDLLPAQVRGGLARTVAGPVNAQGVQDGASVSVLVRASDIVLDPEGHPGTVVRRHFSGSENVYCVQLDAGMLVHCSQPAGVEISRGSRVGVKLSSDELTVFSS